MIRLGRALLGGDPVTLASIDGVAYRLNDLLPGAPTDSLDAVFAKWDRWRPLVEALAPRQANPVDVAPDAFLAPVERPMHLVCIGTNYRDHIAEMGIAADPQFPYAFLKPLTTIAPPGGPVTLPRVSAMVDWEAELGVVIGRRARHVDAAEALAHVAGYLPLNDVSARDWVENRPNLGIDWVMQKASDGFTPLGPWVTLARHVPDPQRLAVRCFVNDQLMQDSTTAKMVFSVAAIISHVSRFMTLSPGDVIATGTPAGVAFGMRPRRFLAPGDRARVEIESLGSLETYFVADDGSASGTASVREAA